MSLAHRVEPSPVFAGDPPRKRWTRAECERLELYGLIDGRRYELIEGELFDRMGKNQPHIIWLTLLQTWFNAAFPGQVLAEATLGLSPESEPTSEPQPDLLVLERPVTAFLHDRPQPSDVALLIEVAHSSLSLYIDTKARLYARAAIADYWVVDINARRVMVFREPRNGEYHQVTIYEKDEIFRPLTGLRGGPPAEFCLDQIFPTEN